MALTNSTPNTSYQGGALVLITLHVLARSGRGPYGHQSGAQQRADRRRTIVTSLETQNAGPLPLLPPLTAAANDPGVDGSVTIVNQFVVTAPTTTTAGQAFDCHGAVAGPRQRPVHGL